MPPSTAREILKGLSLRVNEGEVHAIMGPNGAGKSTLASVLTGRDGYVVTGGSATFRGKDLLALPPEDRAREGVFLRLPVPGGNTGREHGQLHAHGGERATQVPQPGAALGHGLPPHDAREEGTGGDGQQADQPLGERRLLRRREETQRDFPDGHARTPAGHPGRDGLRPRHRCAAHRGQRGEQI